MLTQIDKNLTSVEMVKSCNFMKKFEKANELLLKKVKKLLIEGVSDK